MFNKMFLNHFCLRKAHTKYSIEMEMFNRQQKKIMDGFMQAQ